MSKLQKLNVNQIKKHLDPSHQYNFLLFDELPSTNTYTLENLQNLSENTVVVTELQTAGRGQRENKWLSHESMGLTLSVFKMFNNRQIVGVLPLVTGIAIIRMLKEFGVSAKLKWPNDVFIENKSVIAAENISWQSAVIGGFTKLAGVLIESGTSSGKTYVVIGIGIDSTFGVERNKFCARLLSNIDNIIYELLNNDGFTPLKQEWLKYSIHYNKSVDIYQNNQLVASGVNIDLGSNGAIIIKTANGLVKEYLSASIRFTTTPNLD